MATDERIEEVGKAFHDSYWEHLGKITGIVFRNMDWEKMTEHRQAVIAAFEELDAVGEIHL